MKYYYRAIIVACIIFPLFMCAENANNTEVLRIIKQLIDAKQYENAIAKLNGIEQSCLRDTSMLVKIDYNYFKGLALYSSCEYKEAIPFFKNALQFMPHHYETGDSIIGKTFYYIASSYSKIGDYSNAESYYRKVIISNDIQPLTGNVMSKVYEGMVELYKVTNQPILADECYKKMEELLISSCSPYQKNDNWTEVVDELFLELPNYDRINHEDKPKVVETFSTILDIINRNVGKNNDDFILYCQLYAMYAQYKLNDTITAINLNKQLIEIGKVLTNHKPEIATAYTDYLRLIAAQNKVDLIKDILPEAVEYYNATKDKNRSEENLYDIVGLGLWEAGNIEEAVKYLEMEWNGEKIHTIRSLGNLADYYYNNNPSKALSYLYQIETIFSKSDITTDETKITVYQSIMDLNSQLGNNTEALIYGNKLVQLFYVAGDNDKMAQYLADCGVIYGRNHDLSNAQKMFDRVDDIFINLSKEAKVYCMSNRGFVFLLCDEYEKAIDYLKQSIGIAIQDKGEANPQLMTIYHNLGRAYMLQQKYDDALKYLYMSKDMQMSTLGSVIENTRKYINECEANK